MSPIYQLFSRSHWGKRFGKGAFATISNNEFEDTIIRIPFREILVTLRGHFAADFIHREGVLQGIRRYPRNVNVAVALSLAAETPVELELWADPGVTRNTHEVIVAGEFGESVITVQNVPSPDNPATSYLAALSILTLLDDLDRPLLIGT